MIKIAHVTASLKKGGAEEILCSLVTHLDTTQFTSQVLYFHHGPHVEHLRIKNIELHHIRGLICMYDPVFWFRLIRTLYLIKPDCIHALLWSSQCASRVIGWLLRIPVITVYHNQATLESGIRLFIDSITLKCANKIVAVSHTVAQSIKTAHAYVPASHITTITNGIAAQSIDNYLSTHAQPSKTELNIPANAQIIGTVGRLHPVKKHSLLLRAYALVLQKHPNSYLILVGDGPEQDRLVCLCQQLNCASQVIFITKKQAYPYYALFDCFVLPSAQEGMSLALLEAHYFKCASVVAHNSPEHDIITHGHNGLLVKPDDAHDLARAIHSVLDNKALQHKLGNNAYNHVIEKHTITHMVTQYEQLFKKVS